MRRWILAMGIALSFSGLALANQPDPAYGGQSQEKVSVQDRASSNHQETRSDRQVRDGRQEARGTSTSHTNPNSSHAQRSHH